MGKLAKAQTSQIRGQPPPSQGSIEQTRKHDKHKTQTAQTTHKRSTVPERSVKALFNVAYNVLIDFSLTVKATTLIFISGRGSAISSAQEGKSDFIYNLVKS